MTTHRFFIPTPLVAHALVPCSPDQAHHVRHVLRLADGAPVEVMNGVDGTWQATLVHVGKRDAQLQLGVCLAPQCSVPDIWLVCSPLRQNRLDVLVEKATELGVARILPVRMQHSSVRQANEARLQQVAIEAAEQCGRDTVPEIAPLQDLSALLGQWPATRPLLMADEAGIGHAPAVLLPALQPPLAVLIGPEGGFSATEQAMLRAQPFVQGMTLGPRILRAETAGIAALSVVLAWCGDWHEKPRFTTIEE